jgi:ABC-type branched-subunit amino acid transport system permease subunit
MSTPSSAHRSEVKSLLTLLATGIIAIAFILWIDSQITLVGVLALAVAIWVYAIRDGISERAGRALVRSPSIFLTTVAIACVIYIIVFHNNDYALLMVATALLYAAAGIGLNIQTGLAGIANFSGAAFFTAGGYVTAVILKQSAAWGLLALIAGGLVAALIGTVLMLPVLRTKGYYTALVTIAFGVLLSSFLQVNDGLGGAQGLTVSALHIGTWDMSTAPDLGHLEVSFYWGFVVLSLVVFITAALLARRVEWSPIGISLDALRNDEIVSASFGISVQRWKITAFVFGNFILGLSGAVYGAMTGFVSPAGATFEQSLLLLSIVVLGGIGNTAGALVAAAIIVLIPEKMHALQEYRLLIFAVAVVLTLLFNPKGLIPRRMRVLQPAEK